MAGKSLILDEIHAPGAGVPGRMAPRVLAGTVVTHVFGGSAGREGTAVQVGGAVSEESTKSRRWKLGLRMMVVGNLGLVVALMVPISGGGRASPARLSSFARFARKSSRKG